jgi:hypothetical protein
MLTRILVAIIAADLAGGLVASSLVLPNAPLESGQAAHLAPSVNRALKGNPLPRIELRNEGTSTNNPQRNALRPKRIPLGCDPAFSPIADRTLVNLFGRCTA